MILPIMILSEHRPCMVDTSVSVGFHMHLSERPGFSASRVWDARKLVPAVSHPGESRGYVALMCMGTHSRPW